jgi:hypothetical protein
MTDPATYASIAVIDHVKPDKIAIEVISVTPDVCELSGAWLLEKNQIETFNQIVEGRLILVIGEASKLAQVTSKFIEKEVKLEDFLNEAKSEVSLASEAFQIFVQKNEEAYRQYMSISPAERKNLPKVTKKLLTEPDFFEWPSTFVNIEASDYLESIGKIGIIKGGDLALSRTLAFSRTLKLFIEKWKNDEVERKNKIYVEEKNSDMTILPKCWLVKV